MLGVGVVLTAIVLIIAIAMYATSSLTDVIENQLTALKAGDLEKAYTYTSKDFQNVTSRNDFERFIDHYPSLKNNKSVSFNSKEISNDIGIVKGALYSTDGATTPIEYRLVKENNEWKIMGIAVSPAGTLEGEEKPVASKSVLTPTVSKVYENKDSRYNIKYPANWEYESPGMGTVIFSGKKDTPSYYSTINIQTVLTKKHGGDYADVRKFIADIKKQATSQSRHVKFLESGPFTLPDVKGEKIKGEYLIFQYEYKGVTFKQWQIVVVRNDNQVFYAWAYTSPIQLYQDDLPIAKLMLDSWKIY